MNIVIPSKPSRAVTDFKEAEVIASQMVQFLRTYKPLTRRKTIALHHSQVSTDPIDLFVVEAKTDNRIGYVAMMNVKVREKSDPEIVAEACVSFPMRGEKRVKRYGTVVVDLDEFDEDGNVQHRENITLLGLYAHVVQHEKEHAQGRSIYSV